MKLYRTVFMHAFFVAATFIRAALPYKIAPLRPQYKYRRKYILIRVYSNAFRIFHNSFNYFDFSDSYHYFILKQYHIIYQDLTTTL